MPTDRHQSSLLEQIRLGDVVAIDVRKDRNPGFHRKFFAMLRETFEMQDVYDTDRQWRAVVTCGAGYCTWSRDEHGNLVAVPDSISFDSMDETEFGELYRDAVRYIDRTYVKSDGDLIRLLEFT